MLGLGKSDPLQTRTGYWFRLQLCIFRKVTCSVVHDEWFLCIMYLFADSLQLYRKVCVHIHIQRVCYTVGSLLLCCGRCPRQAQPSFGSTRSHMNFETGHLKLVTCTMSHMKLEYGEAKAPRHFYMFVLK